VTDFGGSFVAFNSWLATSGETEPPTLLIPAGTHTISSSQPLVGHHPGAHLQGAGAGVSILHLTNPNGHDFGPGEMVTAVAEQPRFFTAHAGQNYIRLQDPTKASLFTVGKWVLLMAQDMQSQGFPQNDHNFEFLKIAAVDTETGKLTFETPVADTYKDTYVQYIFEGGTQFDQGGTPTIFRMADAWSQDTTVSDLTLRVDAHIFKYPRNTLWERCEFDGKRPPIQSVGTHWTAKDCNFNDLLMEVDKLVENITFENCTGIRAFVQSSSIRNLTMFNCSGQWLRGLPRVARLTNCRFDELGVTPTAYGPSRSVWLTNCHVSSALTTGSSEKRVASSHASFSDGVIAWNRDLAPGGGNHRQLLIDGEWHVLYTDEVFGVGPLATFKILDVWHEGRVIYYRTTLPHDGAAFNAATQVGPHPCPYFTVRGGTGLLAPFSYPAAYAKPYLSYYNTGTVHSYSARSFNNVHVGIDVQPSHSEVFGQLEKITVRVLKSYTGVRSTLRINLCTAFNGFHVYDADYSASLWQPSINLKVAGTRVITPTGTTGTAAGDVNATYPSGSVWMRGRASPSLVGGTIASEDPSVWPVFQYEAILDQGIPAEGPATGGF
jgi:hypothetical protein